MVHFYQVSSYQFKLPTYPALYLTQNDLKICQKYEKVRIDVHKCTLRARFCFIRAPKIYESKIIYFKNLRKIVPLGVAIQRRVSG